MVVITLSDIIGIGVFIFFVIIILLCLIVGFISNIYKEKSKKWHNCFECKHYYCRDVASFGGISFDKCKITGVEDRHDFNDSVEYRKCKNFENKE